LPQLICYAQRRTCFINYLPLYLCPYLFAPISLPYIFAPIYLPLFIGAKYSSICPYVFIGVKYSLITGSVPTLKASRYTMLLTLLALKDCYRPCDCGARGRGGAGGGARWHRATSAYTFETCKSLYSISTPRRPHFPPRHPPTHTPTPGRARPRPPLPPSPPPLPIYIQT